LSGALAAYGKSTLDGIQLRVNLTNAAAEPGADTIKLYVEDNRGDKTESRNAYKKLVGSNKVVAVIGPITSTNTLGVRRDVKALKNGYAAFGNIKKSLGN